MTKQAREDLSAIDWLRDQIVNDNDLEICATEEERVKMLAMLSRQKKRRKAIVDSETKLL